MHGVGEVPTADLIANHVISIPDPNALLAREAAGYPPTISLEEVRALIDAAPREHPRLLATGDVLRGLREHAQGDPTRRLLAEAVIAQAEASNVDELGKMVVSNIQLIEGITRTLTSPSASMPSVTDCTVYSSKVQGTCTSDWTAL